MKGKIAIIHLLIREAERLEAEATALREKARHQTLVMGLCARPDDLSDGRGCCGEPHRCRRPANMWTDEDGATHTAGCSGPPHCDGCDPA